jgi:hypothetical protein
MKRDSMMKGDEYSRKIAELTKLAEQYGVKIKESSIGSIGLVGGVRPPTPKDLDDNNDAGGPNRS